MCGEAKKALARKNLHQLSFLINTFDALPEYAHYDSKQRCEFVGTLIRDEVKLASSVLERLATWILAPEMPADVFSDRQMRRRVNDKEVLFHEPQRNNYEMELDGNRCVKSKPNMDSSDSHKVTVKLPSDRVDRRTFNGPLEKYRVETWTFH